MNPKPTENEVLPPKQNCDKLNRGKGEHPLSRKLRDSARTNRAVAGSLVKEAEKLEKEADDIDDALALKK